MMRTWLSRQGTKGWTAVDSSSEGAFGVSVLASHKSGTKPRVIKCGSVNGGALNADTLEKLGKMITTGGCDWTYPLERKDYRLLVIQEPPVLPTEMEESVRWSITTMLDYPATEATLGWIKIPTAENLPNRPPHIYVVATRTEQVDQVADLFRQVRLPLKAVDVRETAHRNIAALAETRGEGLGLLIASKQGVEFIITFKGELYLDRFVEESLFNGTERDEETSIRMLERIALQVQRSLDFIARTMPFINVGRVLVAPTPVETNLVSYLSQNLPTQVEHLNLSSVFDFSLTPELMKSENQARYFTALGAALRFV